MRYGWGAASSPVLHQGRLYIVNDNEEQSFLEALDAKTGKQIWRVARDEGSNWATPFVWESGKRTEIVTAGTRRVRAYDLDGKLLWELGGMSSIAIPTPFAKFGLLYVTSGYVGDQVRPVYAVRPGASGDISLKGDETSNEFVAWYQRQGGPYNPSPLVYGDYYYTLMDFGFLTCRDARTGKEIYGKQRINTAGAAFTASPWAYNGKIFALSEDGDTYVIQAGTRVQGARQELARRDVHGHARDLPLEPDRAHGIETVPDREGEVAVRLAAAILLAGCLHAADEWPQFRGNPQLTGVATGAVPATLKLLWTYDAGEGIQSSAAIADGTVYVGVESADLLAIDLATGKLRWKYRGQDGIDESSPLVHDGVVYVGDIAGTLHAVRAADGTGAVDLQDRQRDPVFAGNRRRPFVHRLVRWQPVLSFGEGRQDALEVHHQQLRARHAGHSGRPGLHRRLRRNLSRAAYRGRQRDVPIRLRRIHRRVACACWASGPISAPSTTTWWART